MPTVNQIRGAILEEIVLKLLENAGYRILNSNNGNEIRNGHSGLELQGRGEWHQVDALVSCDSTPAFIYPIRLIVEAKTFLKRSKSHYKPKAVGIDVVRNAVGRLKDVNENFFSHKILNYDYKWKRFNYTHAIFSLGGFTESAQRYAIAHQVFLIQYYFLPLFSGIRDILSNINDSTARQIFHIPITSARFILKQFREVFKQFIRETIQNGLQSFLTEKGLVEFENLKQNIDRIGGSYFGLLNGEYPIHLLSERSLPEQLFESEDEINVRIHVSEAKCIIITLGNNNLYFELPISIAELFTKYWEDKMKIARLKERYVSFITLTGKIGNVRRSIKLNLDRTWLNEYIERMKKKSNIS